MQVNQIGLIKKKHVSQLTPAAINETEQLCGAFAIEDSHIGRKSNTRGSNENDNNLDYDNKVGLFASGAQLNSERSEQENGGGYEITNIKLGSHPELEYKD